MIAKFLTVAIVRHGFEMPLGNGDASLSHELRTVRRIAQFHDKAFGEIAKSLV